MTLGRYLCFHKHWGRNINAYLNIFSREIIFLLKGNSEIGLIIEVMIQKNLKGLEIIEVLITSHVKVFLSNKYNNYIHTTQNAKVELLEMLMRKR